MQVDDKRQHVSDAAWEALKRLAIADGVALGPRDLDEQYFARAGVIAVTVEEYDQTMGRVPFLEKALETALDQRDVAMEHLRMMEQANLKLAAQINRREEAKIQKEKPETRATSWPAPAHRARWIPFL